MKYTFLMFVFFTAILFSFGQEKTDTGAFTELKVANKIYIELISSTEDKIEFVTGSIKDLSIDNKEGRLVIKNNIKSFLKEGEYPLKIKIYSQNLKVLDVESGSYVFSNEILKSSIKINANFGSIVELNFSSSSVQVEANSGAQVVLKGKIDHLVATASTSSTISAKNIENVSAKLTVNTGGVIDLFSTGDVDAQTKAGGKINLFGTQKSLKQKVNFGGTITTQSL